MIITTTKETVYQTQIKGEELRHLLDLRCMGTTRLWNGNESIVFDDSSTIRIMHTVKEHHTDYDYGRD